MPLTAELRDALIERAVEVRRLIDSVEVVRRNLTVGNGTQEHIYKVKLISKSKMHELLARHVGLFEEPAVERPTCRHLSSIALEVDPLHVRSQGGAAFGKARGVSLDRGATVRRSVRGAIRSTSAAGWTCLGDEVTGEARSQRVQDNGASTPL